MTPLLTIRQREILDFITESIRTNQRPPTVRGIGEKFGIKSPNGVICHLKALEKKGLIIREADVACGIRLTNDVEPAWRDRPVGSGRYMDADETVRHYEKGGAKFYFQGPLFGPIPDPPVNGRAK